MTLCSVIGASSSFAVNPASDAELPLAAADETPSDATILLER